MSRVAGEADLSEVGFADRFERGSEPRRLSVLSAHNYYQQPGGEDQAFRNEALQLVERGHRVVRYSDHNDRIGVGSIAAVSGAIWNQYSYRRLRDLVREHKPDVAHFHNTFPLISPAAYYAVRSQGVPVVQTLHNYRLICPGATLFRDGRACEECVSQHSLTPALIHGCYRSSRTATAGTAAMLTVHRATGTWQRMVDVYIAVSRFARAKFIEGGLPPERIVVKSGFADPDPWLAGPRGRFALFVGRLSEEKGVGVLARAWHTLSDIHLHVAGDGPARNTDWPAGVKPLGYPPREQVLNLMREATVLIVPSIWYEGAPATILEAFACGLPVIASDIGSLPEFVEHGRTGLLFRPGDAEDLARQVRWAFDHPEQLLAMRAAARREYEDKYTPERNYKMLMEIYEMAMESARRRAA